MLPCKPLYGRECPCLKLCSRASQRCIQRMPLPKCAPGYCRDFFDYCRVCMPCLCVQLWMSTCPLALLVLAVVSVALTLFVHHPHPVPIPKSTKTTHPGAGYRPVRQREGAVLWPATQAFTAGTHSLFLIIICRSYAIIKAFNLTISLFDVCCRTGFVT